MTDNVINLAEERKKRGLVPKETPVLDEAFDELPIEKGAYWEDIVSDYMKRYAVTRMYLRDHEMQPDPGDEDGI